MEPMITQSEMYWLTRMDYITTGMMVSGVISLFLCALVWVVTVMLWDDSGKDYHKEIRRYARRISCILIPIGFALFVGRIFVPTTREMAAIKVIPAIVNNERIRGDCEELYGLGMEWAKKNLGAVKSD